MGIPETGCLARRMLLNVTGRHLVLPFSTQIPFPTTHHHVEQGRLCDGQAAEAEREGSWTGGGLEAATTAFLQLLHSERRARENERFCFYGSKWRTTPCPPS